MAIGRAQSRGGANLNARERFRRALVGEGVAFAPIVWERLPELVHQERTGWWRDCTVGQRLIADAAELSGADAMFVLAADEAVRSAVAAGARGDSALEALAEGTDAQSGAELIRVVGEVAAHAVIAAVPAPASLQRALAGEEPEAAEDAFTDLVSASLDAGADAVAVIGSDRDEVAAGVARAARLGSLYRRPVVAVCENEDSVVAWDDHGVAVGVISADGEWPDTAVGLVITAGDVSGRWDAARLRAVGTGRPVATARP